MFSEKINSEINNNPEHNEQSKKRKIIAINCSKLAKEAIADHILYYSSSLYQKQALMYYINSDNNQIRSDFFTSILHSKLSNTQEIVIVYHEELEKNTTNLIINEAHKYLKNKNIRITFVRESNLNLDNDSVCQIDIE